MKISKMKIPMEIWLIITPLYILVMWLIKDQHFTFHSFYILKYFHRCRSMNGIFSIRNGNDNVEQTTLVSCGYTTIYANLEETPLKWKKWLERKMGVDFVPFSFLKKKWHPYGFAKHKYNDARNDYKLH